MYCSGNALRSLLACLALFALPAFGEQTAVVTDLQGTATRQDGTRLAILAEVGAGTDLELQAGARMTLAHLSSARQFDLEGPGRFRLTTAGIESTNGGRVSPRPSLNAAYRNVRLNPAKLAQASISMRGHEAAVPLRLLTPAATWTVDSKPDFRWEAVQGATSYRFQLTDATGAVLHEARTDQQSIVLPAGIALEPDRIYAWQVDASLAEGRIAEGWTEFGVAGPERRRRMELGRPGAGATFGDRVLYALLLDELGFREIAQLNWDELARERPQDPRLSALRSLR
jgi:hypothetical protein